jgi:hypothetical protein
MAELVVYAGWPPAVDLCADSFLDDVKKEVENHPGRKCYILHHIGDRKGLVL